MDNTSIQHVNVLGKPAEVPRVSGLIGIKAGFCDGYPHVIGQRIKVEHVAHWHEHMGMTPEEIVATHPALTLLQVEAALIYYRDHREEIEAGLDDGVEFVEKFRASQPSILEEARQRSGKDDAHSPG